MYCPNCGKTSSTEQKFCRSCGLSLEKVIQSLSEQLTAADLDKNLVERQRKLGRVIDIVAVTTVSIVVGSVIWGIIYAIIIQKGAVLTGSIFLAFILGIVLFALLSMYSESLKKKPAKRQATVATPPPDRETGKLLTEPSIEPISSVTEVTTGLLEVDEKTREK